MKRLIINGGAYLASKAHEVTKAVVAPDLVGAFLVVVRLAVDIGVTGREESSSIKWSVAVQAVGDLVERCRPQGLFVGLPKRLQRAVLADVVALGTNGIVGTLMMVRVRGHVVQLVNYVGVYEHGVA